MRDRALERRAGLSFDRSQRIRKRGEFSRVFDEGQRVTVAHFVVVFALRRPAPDGTLHPRLGLVVSRKSGNAVTRNRIKRCCRESFRRSPDRLPNHVDVLLIPRVGAGSLNFTEVDAELEEAFSRVRKLLAKRRAPSHVP